MPCAYNFTKSTLETNSKIAHIYGIHIDARCHSSCISCTHSIQSIHMDSSVEQHLFWIRLFFVLHVNWLRSTNPLGMDRQKKKNRKSALNSTQIDNNQHEIFLVARWKCLFQCDSIQISWWSVQFCELWTVKTMDGLVNANNMFVLCRCTRSSIVMHLAFAIPS